MVRVESERIFLRKLTSKDATQEYCNWLNDPVVNRYLETRKATIQDLKDYIKEKNHSKKCLFLGIFDKKKKKHIGNLKLEPIDTKKKRATFSIMIGDKNYWGKGLGTEATELIVKYAFRNLNLKRVDLGVISKNKKAIKVYKKVGFEVKRIEKKKLKHGSKFYDKVIMEIRKEDYRIKFLILGCGSIGRRHIKNLLQLGYKDVIGCDSNGPLLERIQKEINIKTSRNFIESLKNVDAVLICTPNHLHTKFAIKALSEKKHVFIEKPIAHKLDNLEQLKRFSEKNNLVVQVGCNLRFHPIIRRTKEILDRNKIGEIYGARIEYGSYLPDWRPGQDYTENYGAKKNMGGGIILDDIHELDYTAWFFGKIRWVFCSASKISNLKINTEDNAEILLKSNKGFTINIHMDYLQKPSVRKFKIIGSKGMIKGDVFNKELIILKDNKKNKIPIKKDYDYNQSYVDELKQFIDCIENNKKPLCGYNEGRYALKIALKAKISAVKKEVVRL
ncbi:GNAT family N-acetyltransferase [Candidatus Woesearchaeota archaeon]|nr:GNAT family N-acetyltransferase [Candidatus Woesearchaeota archaeon]